MAVDSLLPADTPRLSGIDERHVQLLAEIEEPLPPILVHHPSMRVIDGMHRLHAARRNGQDKIEARFFHGTDEQAFVCAVEENSTHGLPLSAAERRAAAGRMVTANPQLSDRSIAATTGLSARTVATLRRRSTADIPQPSSRVGADGRRHPLNGSAGRQRAASIIAAHPSASLRAIARAAEVSVGTAHDVRARVRRGDSPIPGRHPAPPHEARPSRPARFSETASLAATQAGPRDSRSLLQSLLNDPSLRYTNQGRDLLRLLCTHAITPDTWLGLIGTVPPHCAQTVVELARQYASAWTQLAGALSQHTVTTDS
ncbi:MAG TPA: ParB N-terminal domain-containing protein [Streptosporangiaceae bacterium]|nr:ParB N-terminal domain-containing protein [Streptosporangiaceae bacterium]